MTKSFDCRYCGRYICWKVNDYTSEQFANMLKSKTCPVCAYWLELIKKPSTLVCEDSFATYEMLKEPDSHLWPVKFMRLPNSEPETMPLWYRGNVPEKLRSLCHPSIRIVR